MPTKFLLKLTATFVFVNILPAAGAQQSAPSAAPSAQTQPAQPDPQTSTSLPQPNDEGKKENKTTSESAGAGTSSNGTSNDRLFFTLPNFLTLENAGQVPPLTTKQKFAVVTRGSFDYIQIPWYAFLSGINQAEDSEPGFGQGWAGYGKRFATSFADGTIENYMTGAIFPTLLREDPRYFQSGHGSFAHRSLYAVSRNIITRTDAGKNRFNYSEVVGGALAAAISTYSYHPSGQYVTTTTPGVLKYLPSDRTIDNTAKVWATQFGYDAMTLVIKEFWPDIRRKIRKTNAPDVTADTKAGTGGQGAGTSGQH